MPEKSVFLGIHLIFICCNYALIHYFFVQIIA